MTIEAGLYAHLTGDASVTALVGERVYPLMIPQGADLPAIAYQRISTRHVPIHDGPSGLAWARLQITCAADDYSGARALASAVSQSLREYHGTMGSYRVGACFVESVRDEWATPYEAPTVRVDVMLGYEATDE